MTSREKIQTKKPINGAIKICNTGVNKIRKLAKIMLEKLIESKKNAFLQEQQRR